MKTRTFTALIAFAIFTPFLIFSDGFLWNIALSIICGVCMFEVLCCTKMLDAFGLSLPALTYAVLLPLLCSTLAGTLSYAGLLFVFLMFSIGVFSQNRYHVSQITLVCASCLYVTHSLCGLILLRRMPQGVFLMALVFLIAWSTDIGAYLSGRLFGTRRLAPVISPKKTVEGSIGSLIITTLLCLLYGLICNSFALCQANVGLLALVGAVGNLFAQMGDLIASLFKRHYSIKDFGTIFPGHGGFMDRFDSIIGVCVILTVITSRPELITLFGAL